MTFDLQSTELPLLICDPAGRVLQASAAGESVLRAVGVEAAALPESLRVFICEAGLGESCEWTPASGSDLALGLTRYRHGDEGFLVLMRELSGVRRSLVRRLREQRNEIVARMSGEIAHEFRNVLASIVYNVDCVLDPRQPPLPLQQEACIRDVSSAAARLGGVIQVMLEYGRGDVFTSQSLPVQVMLDRVTSFVRADLRRRGHKLEAKAAASLPLVQGNTITVEQIAIGMVVCASAFSAKSMQLQLSAEQSSFAGRPSIAIRLRDDGPGLTPAVRARIFDPLLEGLKGESGVGLALAREAAASIEGELLVESSARGNSFVAHLREAS
ncbi:MAG TPA: ATP-binding protein [Myxococcales bacterium]|nr:ATP-binding protein [Myxococcales bacterium]